MTPEDIQNRTEQLSRESKQVIIVNQIIFFWLVGVAIWGILSLFDVVPALRPFALWCTLGLVFTQNCHLAMFYKKSAEAMMDFHEAMAEGYEAQIKELQAKVTSLSIMKKILNRN